MQIGKVGEVYVEHKMTLYRSQGKHYHPWKCMDIIFDVDKQEAEIIAYWPSGRINFHGVQSIEDMLKMLRQVREEKELGS